MGVSLVASAVLALRERNAAEISVTASGYMSENYAYQMQIRIDGATIATGAAYGNVTAVHVYSISTPSPSTKQYSVQLYTKSSSNASWVLEATKVVSASIPVASYDVDFDANGGEMETTTKTVYYGSEYGDLPVLSRVGYRFSGWYTGQNDGDRITEDTIVDSDPPETLYARWWPIAGGKTSLTIDPEDNSMSMPRGDSAAIIVRCHDEPFTDGDKIEFSIRRKVKTERVVHIVVTEFEEDDDGAAYILIDPEDTQELEFGRYVYDIQLTKANGWVTTIVETSPFILKDEVTYDG